MTAAPTTASPDPYDPSPTLWQRRPHLGWVLAVFGLTAFLLYAAFPPLDVGEAGYVLALAAVLWAYRNPPFRLYAATVLGAQAVGWILLLGWLHNVTWVGMVLLGLFLGLLTGSWYLAVWWVVPRLRGHLPVFRILGFLALAALWVLLEWLRGWFLGGFPWLPLAASQWQRPLLLQVAAYAGSGAVSFVLIMFNLGAAAYVHRIFFEGATGLKKRSPEFMFALLVLAGSSFPLVADVMGQQRRTLARVAVVQPYIPQDEKWDEARARDILRTIEQLTVEAARQGAPDFVLWPEAVTPWAIGRDENVRAWLESVSRRAGKPILLGVVKNERGPAGREVWSNSAVVVDPAAGLLRADYSKRKLVPFGEFIPLRPVLGWLEKVVPIGGDFTPGESAAPLTPVLDGPKVGTLICYEDIFPWLAREDVLAGADLLAVLTNNGWFGEGGAAYQHAAHSVLRAVETRRPVLRCGNGGWSGWIDEYGRIRDTLRNDAGSVYFRGYRTLDVTRDLRWRGRESYYVQHGDWFIAVCAALALAGYWLVLTLRPGRRVRTARAFSSRGAAAGSGRLLTVRAGCHCFDISRGDIKSPLHGTPGQAAAANPIPRPPVVRRLPHPPCGPNVPCAEPAGWTTPTPTPIPMTKRISTNGRLSALGLSACVALLAVGRAQEAPSAPPPAEKSRLTAAEKGAMEAPAAPQREQVVTMSPFEVTADTNGYHASNTLSGTRLNSKIEDLAASITVVTKQQLLDTAAVDINDVFLYEANTEGTGNYTAFSVGRNGDVNDSVQSSPETANRVRGIASANVARGNYASDSRIPVDSYNVDAIEISRGPNSNIFGLGNASGTVNVIKSTANVRRDSTQATLRGDSYGGFRVSADVNRVVIPGKLAVRALALYDSRGYERKPSQDISRRQEAMFTYRPFRNTTIRGSYQSYHNFARRPNALTPRDTVTYWNAAGRPTWDPVTRTATVNGAPVGTFRQKDDKKLPLGLLSQGSGFYNRPSMFIDNGAVRFWSVNRTTSTNNANSPNQDVRFLESGTDIMRLRGSTMPLFTTPGVMDQSLYDWTSVNFVAPNYRRDKADIYNVELDQFLINTPMHLLAAQAGWYREDVDSYSRNFISGNSAVLFVDVNEKLLDGSPNPYFLRPYVGASEPTAYNRPELNDNYRGQVAYQLDLTKAGSKWLQLLGRHRFSGYAEQRRITDGLYRLRDVVLDNHTWVDAGNRAEGAAAGRAYFRYYLGDSQGQNIDYAPPALYGVSGTYDFNWYNGQTHQWISEPATIGETLRRTSNRTQREVRTRGLVMQNFLWNERIITTFGWRKDKNRTRYTPRADLDPATGLADVTPLENFGAWTELSGRTKTQGVVVKPFRDWSSLDNLADADTGMKAVLADTVRGLDFHYNTSDSFQPESAQYNLFGELLPNPTGKGKDYGFTLNLFHGKLVARVNRYSNQQVKSRSGDARIIATRANRLDFGGDGFNLEDRAAEWITQIHPGFTEEQIRGEVYKLMQLPEGFIENMAGKSIGETQDVSSSGWEFEINYNPTRNWTLKVTGAEQKTIDSNLSPNIQRYFDERLPVWTSVRIPTTALPDGSHLPDAGELWWTTGFGRSGTPKAFYEGAVLAPYKLAVANQGKPRSQVREWRWAATTSYKLSGLSDHKWLKDTTVGGSLRWEDKGSIGFLGAAPEADGVIRDFDPNRPVYDSAHTSVDLFIAHRLRLFSDRVSARIQLNVRNAFESGGLRPVGVNPDGQPYNYRIIDPRQFILTASFDL